MTTLLTSALDLAAHPLSPAELLTQRASMARQLVPTQRAKGLRQRLRDELVLLYGAASTELALSSPVRRPADGDLAYDPTVAGHLTVALRIRGREPRLHARVVVHHNGYGRLEIFEVGAELALDPVAAAELLSA